ncbi:hypothetical protein Riv7116_4889 [Rivularia sp. PCC 7116]|uniref:hypothetical protein n=1 Tax=Rivularia sp. PCC 7116 TaxID=373994 RepID=UPI00029F3C79|nr:hypothetical protein [Rivularia sp. PCC 7116]AFY57299.1 hypothetical protein Riv7116_4889 [Rivularia sp. PCC 7116]
MKKELRNKIIHFQISCIILFFISAPILLWMLKTPSSNKKVKDFEYNWQNAVDVVPQPLLAQVKSSLPETKLEKKSIKVLKISLNGAGELFVFDYRSPELCGVAGCLYEVYHSEGERLLQIIADSKLPSSQKLIHVKNYTFMPFPCLIFTQKTNMNSMVSLNKYCFDTGKYNHFHETWTPVEKN